MSYLESDSSNVLKVFNLNTRHTGRGNGLFENILNYIDKEKPDVVLLQEVFDGSLEKLRNALDGDFAFSYMSDLSLSDKKEEAEKWGVAIGSRYPLLDIREDYYPGNKEDAGTLVLNGGLWNTSVLLQARIRGFNFGTTQFTWARGAKPSDEQLQDFSKLEAILKECPDLVLTGDLNSPRGYRIFDSLAKRYHDNIPPEVKTTLDRGVRPEAVWPYVVDGFFASRHYRVERVRMIQGLSDHQGVWGEVQRVV